ncbi:(5-formylfuran-3-yl)methyl phosphate synthase [Methylocystis sp. Sn-Cys]|uniref:(5-formylfuran-3-yl)methyl phosphate synthase n=1 Tax=Methylocystis sp. Sn-Cys TaxID=1701263 RepID=UPI001923667B|nr:(5-formylfuran-3-yl)methyl phosphate synthase [Methylocystis sp. Sn-Cys]MBL1256821.1 dihydroneopterin aldolase [Methylocystis sp. Sn-Cys]
MTLMLASVLSREEAETALAYGADIIDCKDPVRGALGALSLAQIKEIVAAVAGRRPVSAVVDLPHDAAHARQAFEEAIETGVEYVKFALPSTPDADEIIAALAPIAKRVKLVAVLFADLHPDFSRLPALAKAGFHGAMLDTAHKNNGRLIDIMTVGALSEFAASCHELRLAAGLAGALEPPDVPRLLVTGADVIGFRGALCEQGDRQGALSAAAVALIRDLIPTRPDVVEEMAAEWALIARGFIQPPGVDDTDCVFLHDYVLPMEVGAYAHEYGHTQRVRFNVDAEVTRAEISDDMRAVFSYDVIMDAIKMILASGHVAMVETIAERLAESVLLHERVRAVTVQVEKLDVAPGAVGVKIRRERHDHKRAVPD